jgi:hypothetical protein
MCNSAVNAALPTNGLQLWLRADVGVTTNASGRVSSWADQSGNGYNATQADSTKQALWVSSGINSGNGFRPSLVFNGEFSNGIFDGAFDGLVTPNIDLPSAFSAFLVVRINNAAQGAGSDGGVMPMELANPGGAGSGGFWLYNSSPPGGGGLVVVNSGGGSGQVAGNPPTEPFWLGGSKVYLAEGIYDNAGTSAIYRSGQLNNSGPASVGDIPSRPLTLGGRQGSPNSFGLPLIGNIAEVLIYDSALSASDRMGVENYLASVYGNGIPEPTTTTFVVLSALFGFGVVRRKRS